MIADIPAGLEIRTVPARFHAILTNVLTNAAKYGAEDRSGYGPRATARRSRSRAPLTPDA